MQATLIAVVHKLLTIPLNKVAFQDEIKQIEKISLVNYLEVNVQKIIRRKQFRQLLFPNNVPTKPTLILANTVGCVCPTWVHLQSP